jgi:hypothetical protein
MKTGLRLREIAGSYAVSKLSGMALTPGWADGPGFSAILRADDELTIVCLEARVPAEIETERGWGCLRTIGPVAFQTSGIVLSLIEPLSNAGIGVFVLCTFNGEHLLFSEKDKHRAYTLLKSAGHSIEI